jgi:hypothetical protein
MKTNNIFEKREEDMKADMAEARRDRAVALRRVRILETELLELRESVDELAEKEEAMEEWWQKECVRLAIRDGGRGQPVGDKFVRHVRCLLATGSSARSCREQLLLSGQYFLPEVLEAPFCDDIPQLRWFNTQREAMGNEAYLYALTSLAKCDKVEQWGFDETSLDGVPSFNQWCRIREGDSYKVVTMECAGLLPGASAELVAEHVRRTWERGKEALNLLRHELGEEADALVPLVNGGVNFAKLQSVMHDTCNHANKVARLAKEIRNDSGREFYGEEEWKRMEEFQIGWQDFLCGNHTRNLPVDAFNRRYETYMKAKLGPALEAAKYRGGGYTRIEPSGILFIRSICKLTHVGRKQYAKGCPNPTLTSTYLIQAALVPKP